MADQAINSSIITCRRCGKDFAPPPNKLFLPSCPHCGTSLKPLWQKFHNNRNAAVLAVFALATLTAGILLPFISMSQLGQERIFSLLGGINELYHRDHLFLAAILLIFSVLFPYAKLIAILLATSRLTRLSDRARHRLHRIAQVTGRYSLLDILVVAIIIVVVKFQDIAEARALPGTYLFAVAVFLSIAAGFCVNLDSPQSPHD
jgi:paraquat-inducible protein A